MDAHSDDLLLTPQQVSEFLKVPLTTIRSLTRSRCQRPLPSIRVGKCVRFLRSALLEWVFAGQRAA